MTALPEATGVSLVLYSQGGTPPWLLTEQQTHKRCKAVMLGTLPRARSAILRAAGTA